MSGFIAEVVDEVKGHRGRFGRTLDDTNAIPNGFMANRLNVFPERVGDDSTEALLAVTGKATGDFQDIVVEIHGRSHCCIIASLHQMSMNCS